MRNRIKGQLNSMKKAMHRGKGKNGGFSLIEVLVAMIILAIMTLPMLTTFATSAKVNAQARKVEEANAIGQKVIERCKSLSLEELMNGNSDMITNNAKAGLETAVTIDNSATGVYDAKAKLLSNNHYSYYMTMASYNGANVNKDSSGTVCYKGANGLNYYVQTVMSPNRGDTGGTGSGSAWEVNDYSMPAFAEVKDSQNYVVMSQIYEHDTSIKNILPSRSSVVNPASTDSSGNLIAREETSTEANISKLSGIKKVVVLDVNVDYDTSTNSYTETPVLYVKYYREKDALGNTQYSVNNDGDILDLNNGNAVVSGNGVQGDVYIKTYTLGSETGINFISKDFKDVYIFYSAYDRKYGSSGNIASDSVYINMNKNGGSAIPDDKGVNVFLIEQYIASNDSSIDDRDNFRSSVQIRLDCSNVYINGVQSSGTKKLGNNGLNVFSDINNWEGSGTPEPNNITQNYDEDEERYLYTITVNIWVEEGKGVTPSLTSTPYLTLTSTKEN